MLHACCGNRQFVTFTGLRVKLIEINTGCVSLESPEARLTWVSVSKHMRLSGLGWNVMRVFPALAVLECEKYLQATFKAVMGKIVFWEATLAPSSEVLGL